MSISLITVLVLLVGFSLRDEWLPLYLMITTLFGATAALQLTALGGSIITPSILAVVVIFFRLAWSSELKAISRFFYFPEAGFWLLMIAVWALISAYFFPRLLEGVTLVKALGDKPVIGNSFIPLQPVSLNITQAAYAIGSAVAFATLVYIFIKERALSKFRDAIIILAVLNCVVVIINYLEFYAGFPSILQQVRTGYKIFDNYEIGGLMRITGTFSEASAFANFTLPLFAFIFSLALDRYRTNLTVLLSISLLVCLLLSTSGTGYAGLMIYLFSVVMYAIIKGRIHFGTVAISLWVVAVTLVYLLLFEPVFVAKVVEYSESVIFGKLDTDSGQSRSAWNQQAWNNFIDSYGLGIGAGSTYASSIILVLLSNLGVVGIILFSIFLYSITIFNKTDVTPQSKDILITARASGHALLASLAASSVSATVLYLGIPFYAFAAARYASHVKLADSHHTLLAGTLTEKLCDTDSLKSIQNQYCHHS